MPYKDKNKQREYQRLWIRQRRLQWLKANGPCVICGSWQDLEIDHTDPTKKVTHRIWSWNEKVRKTELLKCQVLCEYHHKKKTIDYLAKPDNHGTANTYTKYNCRCEKCFDFMRRHWQRRDRRKISVPEGKTVIYQKAGSTVHVPGCECDFCKAGFTK
jgi:hypothetical protein